MNYFSEMLRLPVVDSTGEKIGVVNDLGIATGEIFPHVTSLAFQGPGKTPFMISWRKYVERFDDDGVYLKCPATDIRFSYLQPDEVLLSRDIMNKQIVDTQGLKVVRVNDIKFSSSVENQLRMLGAEVGARGLLRAIHPSLEHAVARMAKAIGKPLPEDIIAWSYMDLLERSTKQIKLSVSHKTLDELHPADIADIIEKLDPRLRSQVFAQLDTAQAAEAISEFDDEDLRSEMLEGMSDRDASSMLALMDPDDAAEIIDELGSEKAEKLLRLMGVADERAIRNLLGYEEDTAGRIMTSEFVALPATDTVADAVEAIRKLDEDFESVYYVYTLDPAGALTGVLSLRSIIVAEKTDRLRDLAYKDVVWVAPDLDQEEVAEEMAKYNLAAIPVCDETKHILGIVTVDDAMDVMTEEHAEDLQIAGVSAGENTTGESTHALMWFAQRQYWILVWAIAACAIAALVVPKADSVNAAIGVADYITSWALRSLMPVAIMPIVLLAAMRMTSFVKRSFLEQDDHEDEQHPYLAFFAKTTLIGVVLGGVVMLCGELVGGNLFAEAEPWAAKAFHNCFLAASGVIVATYATSAAYLRVLNWRDEHDLPTSGTALTFVAVVLSAVAFSVLGTLPLL